MSQIKTVTQASLHEVLPVGSKQRNRLKMNFQPKRSHGGLASVGVRKTERPFSPKSAQHLILKTSRAKRMWNLLHRKNKTKIQKMAYSYAHRYQVDLFRFSNQGHEIHLLVRAKERKKLADFLRVFCGRVACVVTGAKKGVFALDPGSPTHKRKFWDYLTASTLIPWGAEFSRIRLLFQEYIQDSVHELKNELKILKDESLLPATPNIVPKILF